MARDDIESSPASAQTPPLGNFARSRLHAEKLMEQPLLPKSASFPMSSFTFARKDKHGRHLPQAIAHRGYKAKFPENTMGAFAGAVEIGAHAIETDLHLSKDGVVVISHDPTLKRCFGKPEKIIDCNWDYLKTLRTIDEPHQSMPRLQDLLEYLAKPELGNIWVLLDIKMDNDLDDVMRLIADTIAAVPPAPGKPWKQRIVLGAWAPKYLPFISHHLRGFPITYIGFSLYTANQFFAVPHVSFNLYLPMLVGPVGAAFRRKARRLNRPVYTWTVNKVHAMRWAIAHQLDGVVTDDPKKFLEVCERWGGGGGDGEESVVLRQEEQEQRGKNGGSDAGGSWRWEGWSLLQALNLLRVQLFIWIMTPVILWFLRPGVDEKYARRVTEEEDA